jgi:hypothetical protein
VLSLNSFTKFVSVVFIFFLLSNCSSKKDNQQITFNFENPNQILEETKNYFDKDIRKIFIGDFEGNNSKSVVAVAEKMDSSLWGIKFYHFVQKNDRVHCSFETDVLPGSLKESFFDKIKLADKSYEMFYYNSRDYFMGTGGGEIYLYLIDFTEKQLYYSHFVNDIDIPASLFISDNAKDLKLRNFIISNFKSDYPNLKIVDKDISLD